MNSQMNEDVMWQRVKDLQREAENRRLYGARPSLIGLLGSLALSLARSFVASPSRPARAETWAEGESPATNRVA